MRPKRANLLGRQAVNLGLDPESIRQELARRAIRVAYSTVAGWLNGNRGGPRSMRTLAELCSILELDLDLLRDDKKAAEGDPRARLRARIASLDDKQVELVLSVTEAVIAGRRGVVKDAP